MLKKIFTFTNIIIQKLISKKYNLDDFYKGRKSNLADAVGCLVNLKGEINHVFNLIEKFKNKK